MKILSKIQSLFFKTKPKSFEQDNKSVCGLEISTHIKNVLENEILPGLDISVDHFGQALKML